MTTALPASALPSAPVLAAALIGAGAAVAGLALLMRARPDLLAPLAVLALPFRLPIAAQGRTVNLLIPLYLVVAAGTLALLLPRWLGRAGRAPGREAGGRGDRHRSPADEEARAASPALRAIAALLSPRGLEWLLLGAVVLYGVQGAYSADPGKAAENVAFFYVPFGLLFLLLRDVRWTRELVGRCLAIAVALAVIFAGIGFVEYARRELFLNPKVVQANEFDNYFRVNSLFFDPNIYGRFLALVMVALVAVLLWSGRRREVLVLAAVLAWLLGGLVTSFSQSSIAALLLGMAVLAAYRWDVRATLYTAGALVAIAAVFAATAPSGLHLGLKGTGSSASNATSGRTTLIEGGLELFADRPLQGWGAGSFETQYRRHGHAAAANATSASHTIPVTVAAEQGLIGLAVYLALLLSAFAVLARGTRRSFAPPGAQDGPPRPWLLASPVRPALVACFAALVLHTWTYADFLEDPLTWTLLGIGVALARAGACGEGETRELASSATSLGAGHHA